ncbi:MAG: biotin/lipoyl-containing protein [Luteolibacter sp.]
MSAIPLTNSMMEHPLVHRERLHGRSSSKWVRSFACTNMSVLIIGRGPIRKEAIDVFREMGMTHIGILLSERDSIVYPRALAPELRIVDPAHVHHVTDYTGTTREERVQRTEQMIGICRRHGYHYIFAGYGFMAEDADFVRAIECAGLQFIGPSSGTQEAAGRKDEAKRTALHNGVSVTPGINNAAALTLLKQHPGRDALTTLALTHELDVTAFQDTDLCLEDLAEAVLNAAYAKGIDLHTIDELAETLRTEAVKMLERRPGCRLRLKAIGGGGGKGQRILDQADATPGLVREILQEVKAMGVGDNKNLLLELNIEETRHNEVQMLGNGEWCVTLGARDCSLQMHEQKLVEISITQEALQTAIGHARRTHHEAQAKALEMELATIQCMESEAERFGHAVRLDSAATFECIVQGPEHYLMEVNTRIQVEHRVSELCYALRFTNPADPSDHFDVHSLVEAMALIARHQTRLPRPERIPREGAAIEVRLNATDRSLSPHAGGVIVGWSAPIPGEIRDDQGISITNPDTGLFMRYRLAGAYDSNIALLLATGATRAESYQKVTELLRRTTLRGQDLATNLEFHYGLASFFASQNVWAKPTTRFVTGYLTLVGLLKREADSLDLNCAVHGLFLHAVTAAKAGGPEMVDAVSKALEIKETLIFRPMSRLLEDPNRLSGWLSEHRHDHESEGTRVRWLRNPVEVLAATYHSLHMSGQPAAPAAHVIWDHDRALLDKMLGFYQKITARASEGIKWPELEAALGSSAPSFGFESAQWMKIRAAHAGFQLGFELLSLLPLIARRTGFYELRVRDDLTVNIPERLLDPELHTAMKRVLAPLPAMKSDEIVAVSGGILYAQEAPGMPRFVGTGSHFEAGDTLYIIEVMKMFNKVSAPFAGTVDEILVSESGTIVQKGQVLFKITPDERAVVECEQTRRSRVNDHTAACMAQLLG